MRMIGECPSRETAQRFADYLLTLGIAGEVRDKADRGHVWVYNEDEVARAVAELAPFLREPDAPRYAVARQAEEIRRKAEPAAPAAAAPPVPALRPFGFRAPITTVLVVTSLLVSLLSDTGPSSAFRDYLFCDPALVAQGQIWRLFTPVFVHFSFLHILFNVLWMNHLGGTIESAKGPLFYAVLVIAIACGSNIAQALLKGPSFGGLSGVVYGLFGYIWMKSRFQPFEGLALDQFTVLMMLAWLVMGMFGAIGPVANWVHGVGLLIGIAFGGAPALVELLRRGRRV